MTAANDKPDQPTGTHCNSQESKTTLKATIRNARNVLAGALACVIVTLFSLAIGVNAQTASAFNDSDWVSLGGLPGVNGSVDASCMYQGQLYVAGSFDSAGNVSAGHIAEWNGSSWLPVGAGFNGQVSALVVLGTNLVAAGNFTMAGGVPANNIAQWNGKTWSPLSSGFNGQVAALAVSGNILYAGGTFSMAGGVIAYNVAQWDGKSWSALGTGTSTTGTTNYGYGGYVNALAVEGTTLFAGGWFTMAGGTSANHIAQWNGTSWSALEAGTDDAIFALAVSGNNLYVGGQFGTAGGISCGGVAQWNGSSWAAMGSGFQDDVHALAVSNGTIYAGGGFGVAQWNGNSWAGLGTASYNIYTLTPAGNNLFAGGLFNSIGAVTVDNVAQWTGSSWSALKSTAAIGATPPVSALLTVSNTLYIGGGYNNSLSVLNSGTLSSVPGMAGGVQALAAIGGNLYAGGELASAGGIPVSGIAEWTGTTWSGMRGGMQGMNGINVNALAVSGTNLYVGGLFSMAGGTMLQGFPQGGVAADNVAAWNGTTWSAIGAGLNGQVNALAISGNVLYAGGEFELSGTGPDATLVRYVAGWNGYAWFALGTGLNGYVNAMAVAGTNLYVGGSFTSAGNVPAMNVARWDGNTWSSLGSGMNAPVSALAIVGTNLIAAGSFTNAGGTLANYIAEWNGSSWLPMGSGVNSFVYALAASGDNLYVGGNFSAAGSNASPGIAEALFGPATTGNQPVLITFDDLPETTFATVPIEVTNGYCGLLWSNFAEIDGHSGENGYYDGVISASNICYNEGGSAASISNSTPFDLVSGYFTAAFNQNLQLQIQGFSHGVLAYSNSYELSTNVPSLLNLNFSGVDAVYFNSFGGSGPPNLVPSGTQFVMDNLLVITNVPTAAPPQPVTLTDGVTLLTNGYGTIQHSGWPTMLVSNENYTVTATPDAGELFAGWTGGTNGVISLLSTSPTYTFTFEPGFVLEANFVTNSFPGAHGTYQGLFEPVDSERAQTNSGQFTLTVGTSGTVSGRLTIGSQSVSISGTLDPEGTATIVSKGQGGGPPLTTTLQLDFTNDSINGSVTDGSFVAALNGYLSAGYATGPYIGSYTVVIPGVNDPAVGPFGTSYGTVKVSASGRITFSGSLADGTPVSESSAVLMGGYWPFYVSLYGGKGSLLGWNLFTNQTIVSVTPLSWINTANPSKTALYRSGFTNQQATVSGGLYMPGNPLPSAMTVNLQGGNLPFAIADGVTISTAGKMSLTNSAVETNKLSLAIQNTTGIVSGSFVNPTNPKQTIKIHGVFVQGQTNAMGYFLGNDESGTFDLNAQ